MQAQNFQNFESMENENLEKDRNFKEELGLISYQFF